LDTDTTHKCPAIGCLVYVAFEQLACKKHWNMVSTVSQSRLYRAWRNDPGSDTYFRARAQCLREMGVPADQVQKLNGGMA
jgi:hypothetical protein